eukprot:2160985-Heterocapsa_arctica.AAC.1
MFYVALGLTKFSIGQQTAYREEVQVETSQSYFILNTYDCETSFLFPVLQHNYRAEEEHFALSIVD